MAIMVTIHKRSNSVRGHLDYVMMVTLMVVNTHQASGHLQHKMLTADSPAGPLHLVITLIARLCLQYRLAVVHNFSRDTLNPTSPGNSANSLFSKVLLPAPDGPARTSGRQSAVHCEAIKIRMTIHD